MSKLLEKIKNKGISLETIMIAAYVLIALLFVLYMLLSLSGE